MAFIQHSLGNYIYEDKNGKRIPVDKKLLLAHFRAHDELLNPLTGKLLTCDELYGLYTLAEKYDFSFAEEISNYKDNTCNISILENQNNEDDLKNLLNVGLILLGWNEGKKYPKKIIENYDSVALHLRMDKYLEKFRNSDTREKTLKMTYQNRTFDEVLTELEDIKKELYIQEGIWIVSACLELLQSLYGISIKGLDSLRKDFNKNLK